MALLHTSHPGFRNLYKSDCISNTNQKKTWTIFSRKFQVSEFWDSFVMRIVVPIEQHQPPLFPIQL